MTETITRVKERIISNTIAQFETSSMSYYYFKISVEEITPQPNTPGNYRGNKDNQCQKRGNQLDNQHHNPQPPCKDYIIDRQQRRGGG